MPCGFLCRTKTLSERKLAVSVTAKRVSNYELFYDLVFVMATSSMVGMFHHVGEHSPIGALDIIQFVVVNISFWSLWFTQNIYMNKYSRRDRDDIYSLILSMLVIGNLAINLHAEWRTTILNFNGLSLPTYFVFNGLLILAYAIILLQYWLHGRRYKVCTPDMAMQMRLIVFVIVILLLTLPLIAVLPVEMGVYVYGLAYLLIVGVPLWIERYNNHDAMNFPHLVERMQLITILTFGEAVISVIRTFPLSQNVWLALVTFACLGAAFINYVSQTAISLEHNQKNSPTLLISAHLVLLMGLNMFTVGIELTTSDLAYLTSPFLVLLGLVIYHLCLLLTSRYNKEELRLTRRLLLQYVGLLALGVGLAWYFRDSIWIFFSVIVLMEYAMMRVGYLHRRDWIRQNLKF